MSAFEQFSQLPSAQLLLIVLYIVTTIGGSYLASFFHARRVGRRWTIFTNMLDALRHYNKKEWLVLLGSQALGIIFAAIGISLG